MRTVPAGAAATLLAARPDLRAALGGAGRMVGTRTEVDLAAAAAAAGPEVAELLEAYGGRCAALWAALEEGRPGPEWLAVRRPLATHQQVTGKRGRSDLVEVYEALSELPGVAEILEQVTAAEPVLADLRLMASSLGGTVETSEPDSVTLQLALDGGYAYHDLLGGVRWPGEVRRVLTLLTRQAAWRDRRVRRLARVDIAVDELWAEPGDLAAAVAALPAA